MGGVPSEPQDNIRPLRAVDESYDSDSDADMDIIDAESEDDVEAGDLGDFSRSVDGSSSSASSQAYGQLVPLNPPPPSRSSPGSSMSASTGPLGRELSAAHSRRSDGSEVDELDDHASAAVTRSNTPAHNGPAGIPNDNLPLRLNSLPLLPSFVSGEFSYLAASFPPASTAAAPSSSSASLFESHVQAQPSFMSNGGSSLSLHFPGSSTSSTSSSTTSASTNTATSTTSFSSATSDVDDLGSPYSFSRRLTADRDSLVIDSRPYSSTIPTLEKRTMELLPSPVNPEGVVGMPVVYNDYSDDIGEFASAVMAQDPHYNREIYSTIGSNELYFQVGMSSSMPDPILYPQPFYQHPGVIYGSSALTPTAAAPVAAVKQPSMAGALHRDSLMYELTPMISGRLGASSFSHISSSASSSRSGSVYAGVPAVASGMGMGSIAPSLLSTPSPPPTTTSASRGTPALTTAPTATSASVSTNSSSGRVRVSGRRNALHYFSPYPAHAMSLKSQNKKDLDELAVENNMFDYEDERVNGGGNEAVTPLPLHYSPYASPAVDVVSDQDLQAMNLRASTNASLMGRERRTRRIAGPSTSSSSWGAEGSTLQAFLSAGPLGEDPQSFSSNEMSSSSSSSSSSPSSSSPSSFMGSPLMSRTHTPTPSLMQHSQSGSEFVSSLALDFSPSSSASFSSGSSSSSSGGSMMSFLQAPTIDVSYYG